MNAVDFKNWLALTVAAQHQAPLVMGILNITPDSFSDGGQYSTLAQASAKAMDMIAQGVDIIDIGAASSRPGAQRLSPAEEIQRLKPVLKQLRAVTDMCISIDTSQPEVMAMALDHGADVINDIDALTQIGATEVLLAYDAPVCLMHQSRQHAKPPQLWQAHDDICQAVLNFFEKRLKTLVAKGFAPARLILDPGIGFGKVCQDNLTLIKEIDQLSALCLPILVGASRKSFIGEVLGRSMDGRMYGGMAVTACTFMKGATIHRTHDVTATKEILQMLSAILEQDTTHD